MNVPCRLIVYIVRLRTAILLFIFLKLMLFFVNFINYLKRGVKDQFAQGARNRTTVVLVGILLSQISKNYGEY